MSIIKHVTLQKIVAHDFRYGPRISRHSERLKERVGQTFRANTAVGYPNDLQTALMPTPRHVTHGHFRHSSCLPTALHIDTAYEFISRTVKTYFASNSRLTPVAMT